jgi:hypothetical protein
MSSSFTAELLASCSTDCREIYYRTNGILAQKKSLRQRLPTKIIPRECLSNSDFIALSSVEKLTAAQSVQNSEGVVTGSARATRAQADA